MPPPVPSGRASTSHATDAECTSAVSSPTGSRVSDSGNAPSADRGPYPGFSPTTPQSAAGVPPLAPVPGRRAGAWSRPAPAAADPDDDPPVIREGSCGLRAGPVAATSPVGP